MMEILKFVCTNVLILAIINISIIQCEKDGSNAGDGNDTIVDQKTLQKNSTTTDTSVYNKVTTYMTENSAMLKRGSYVFIAVGVLMMIYFGVRYYRTKKRKVKSYGLLRSSGETFEMNPLDSDSDDDYTVYETKTRY